MKWLWCGRDWQLWAWHTLAVDVPLTTLSWARASVTAVAKALSLALWWC